MTDPELLSAAIDASGRTVHQFARHVLVRDPRRVFRWLKGECLPMPSAVREKCRQIVTRAARKAVPP